MGIIALGTSIASDTLGLESTVDPDSIQWSGPSLTDHPTSKLSTARVDGSTVKQANATFMAGKLIDPGTVTMVADHVPGTVYPIGQEDDWTITYPLESGQATAAKDEFTGYIQAVQGPNLDQDGIAKVTLVFKLTGDIVPTAAVDS